MTTRKRPASSQMDPPQMGRRTANKGHASVIRKRPAARKPNNWQGKLWQQSFNGECYDGGEYNDAHTHVCWYFQNGGCGHGDTCKYLHVDSKVAGSGLAEPVADTERDASGVRFIVDRSLGDWLLWKSGVEEPCTLPVGPVRLRIVGGHYWLGRDDEGEWNPQHAMDLFWEGDRWTSLVLPVAPAAKLHFCVVAVDQDPACPGLLLGYRRREVHEARRYTWGKVHSVDCPAAGEVMEVFLYGSVCDCIVRPRYEIVARPGIELPGPSPAHAGEQRCYSFEDPSGNFLNFSLYLPTDYKVSAGIEWPLVVFLHSMHCCLDHDNNLFYESETPLWLLQTNSGNCPQTLRKRCILMAPACREETGTIWLRDGCMDGWFAASSHNPDKEAALSAVINAVARTCCVDRRRISVIGSSMGGYAALELAKRWPLFFSAAGLAAAHYELDPLEPLITRLVEDEIPLWFFHATNDTMCPHDDIEAMVQQLRSRSKAEIRFTSYFDTWSMSGHHVDPVAFFAPDPDFPETWKSKMAKGEELFEWLALQRLKH